MSLTERRKADREKMADYFEGNWIAVPGFICNRLEPAPLWPGKRCVMLQLEGHRGVRLNLDFNGDSPQPDVHILSWHMALGSSTKYSFGFAPSVNTSHYHKATDIAYGFEALKDLMGKRISAIQSGEAFQD